MGTDGPVSTYPQPRCRCPYCSSWTVWFRRLTSGKVRELRWPLPTTGRTFAGMEFDDIGTSQAACVLPHSSSSQAVTIHPIPACTEKCSSQCHLCKKRRFKDKLRTLKVFEMSDVLPLSFRTELGHPGRYPKTGLVDKGLYMIRLRLKPHFKTQSLVV